MRRAGEVEQREEAGRHPLGFRLAEGEPAPVADDEVCGEDEYLRGGAGGLDDGDWRQVARDAGRARRTYQCYEAANEDAQLHGGKPPCLFRHFGSDFSNSEHRRP